MTITGTLTRVDDVETVTALTADVAIGATLLPVDDVTDFNIGDDVMVLDTNVGAVTAVDDTASTLTVPTLASGYSIDDPVILLDTDGQTAVTRIASVDPDDDDQPPIDDALIDPGLSTLVEGVYDPGVPVELDYTDGVYTVVRRLDDRVGWNPHSYQTINATTITAATHTQLTAFTTVETDGFSYGAGSWQVGYAGWYGMNAWVSWASNATGRRRVRFLVNGVLQLVQVVPADPDTQSFNQASFEARLQVGDVVTVWVFQNSGTSLGITDGAFSIHRIST